MHPLIYPFFLTLFIFFCILMILPEHALFGSEGDWFSQHVPIAEQFRTIFYETGQIIPDLSPAGAGSNIYDFSYYGLLRPDVLISFLLPKVPMAFIISGYAILELVAGSILCYCWLKHHVSSWFFAFLGGILYSCAGCFYQAHHQIMFVNYMPFLLLALLGIDRMLEKEKCGLLALSLALAYLHSYYFAPAVLAVVFLYFLYRLYFEKKYRWERGKGRYWLFLFFSIGISVGMAAIVLLPTGLDLLSTRKDAGTPPSLSEICSIRLSLESLLYHPGGCGLTMLCLYTLLLSVRRKSTRILSILLLLCLTVNACPYVLSGFLYIRYKTLIPLVPLILLVCTQTLELLAEKKEHHSLLCVLLCLIPVFFFKPSDAALADYVLTILVFAVIGAAQKYFTMKDKQVPRKDWKGFSLAEQDEIRSDAGGIIRIFYLLLCLSPAIVSITVGSNDQFILASDNRQAVFSKEELQALDLDGSYRFDCLTEPFANANVLPLQGIGSACMYSSVTDSRYADFFYNTMRNPIRIRNRVALMTDANPFFSYLMGIRYIQAKEDALPLGYEPIARKGQTVIAENCQALPTAYISASFMEQAEFEKLEFPYTLEALTRYTVTPTLANDTDTLEPTGHTVMSEPTGHTVTPEPTGHTVMPEPTGHTVTPGRKVPAVTAESFMETSRITPVSMETLTGKDPAVLFEDIPSMEWSQEKQEGTLAVSLKKSMQISLPLPEPLKNKILICSFAVESPKHKEVTIDINGIRNRLSGSSAPYPNQNHTFTYLLSSNQEINALDIDLKAGEYLLSEFKFWVMDAKEWGNSSIRTADFETATGKTLVQGTASCNTDSFFVTSFPFRKGYEAWVDGKQVPVQLVNESFVGFPLSAGSHKITVTYQPPGKTAAGIISLASLLLFFLGMFSRHRAEHNRKNFRNLSQKGSKHK